jgi:HEAT repeat protein
MAEPDAASPEAGAALLGVVRGGSHHAVRRAAAEAVFEVGGAEPYLKAVRQDPRDARVRAGLLETAAEAYQEVAARDEKTAARFLDDLRQLAKRDESYAVRAAAVRELGEIGGGEARSVVLDALDAESQHDQIRRSALGALAAMDEPEGLELALRYTAPGVPARTRPDAIAAVRKLAHHNRDAALEALAVLLRDRESRTARAAGEALAELGGERAATLLDEYASTARGAVARKNAADWLKKIHRAQETAAASE